MKKILSIPFLVLAAILALPALTIPLAHAATGTVCITPGTVTNCPPPPVTITGATGSNIVVNVNIQGSDAFLGVDVSINMTTTSNTVLNGVSVDLSSSLLTTCSGCNPFITSICINNVVVTGSCFPGVDGPGVVHVTKIDTGPGVPAGAVGNLFKITYHVLSQTHDTIGYQANAVQCSSSSVPPFCVTIGLANSEILQGANFLAPPPMFTYTLAATPASVLRNPLATSTATSTVTATLVAGTSQPVQLTGTAPNGITVSFSPNPVMPTMTSTATITVPAASTTPAGTYTITVTGKSTGVPDVSTTFTLTVTDLAPHLAHGKMSWTHHLSLTKNPSGQGWTAIVSNPLSVDIFYLVHIHGNSIAGTMNSFDVMCGSTGCFGTGSATGTSTPILVSAGALTKTSFNQMIPFTPPDKFGFTATLVWGSTAFTVTNVSNSKSGAFAIVP